MNAVLPGAIATERQQTALVYAGVQGEIMESQALKIEIVPDDVARLVLFLAADDSRAITGQSYVIDAGWV